VELRSYQTEALDSILQNLKDGIHQQLLVMATGCGKTVIFSQLPSLLADVLPGRMLVIVHREELVDQAIHSIQKWNPTLKVGKEMAAHRADTDSDVIVACVASIGRSGSTRMERFDWDTITKVVCDEAHHSIASTYLNVFEDAGVLREGTHKFLLGVTATPKRKNLTRSEKKQVTTLDDEELLSLKSVYKKIVYTYPVRRAIKDGWLVPIKGFRLKTTTDLSNVKTTAGDFAQDQLADAVNTEDRNLKIVKLWMDNAENRTTLTFTVDIKHAQDLSQAFAQQGVASAAVWGDDPERADKIERLRTGSLKVLTNCAVLTEGFDAWQIGCVVLARPTKSSSLFTQMIGRGTRLQEGTGNLLKAQELGYALSKKDVLILDVVDNSSKCSLVTLPSLLGLNPELDLHGESVTAAAEQVEALEEKYPGVPFNNLLDIRNVKAYIESIDLFANPYPEEVAEFSKLTWMATTEGYVLPIPEQRGLSEQGRFYDYKREKLVIAQNELDEFELSIVSPQGTRKLRVYSSLQEAIKQADDVIKRCRPDRESLMAREASWHNRFASEPAKKYLRKLAKRKTMFLCVCEGQTTGDKCIKCGKDRATAGQVAQALNRLRHTK
jgi:superfamily II DNA or RNA helicase